MEPPLAHLAGAHWATYLLYVVPLLVVVGSLVGSYVRERNRPGEDDDPGRGSNDEGAAE